MDQDELVEIQNTIYDTSYECPICDLLRQKKNPANYAVNSSILCKKHIEMYNALKKVTIESLD